MGFLDWLSGKERPARQQAGVDCRTDEDDGMFLNVIDIPSRNFIGICARSPSKRFTIAWIDGGPGQTRTGRYLLLDGERIIVEGKMARPNDGAVTDDGVFILNDWGSIETLNGTFTAFGLDGRKLVSRKFSGNLFNNGLSPDGRYAVCQTANAPGEDGNLLTLFDLRAGSEIFAWRPESGWASYYEFPPDTQTIRLGYRDRGAFAYGFDGTFLDRMKWLAAGLQKGDIFIIESLLAESEGQPGPELAAQLLAAIDTALAGLRKEEGRTRARVLKSRGICLEAVAEVKQALAAYEEALALDPKVGVKRRTDQLRKVV
jgi:hypothetical protein